MKKTFLFLFIFLLFLLCSCTSGKPVDSETLDEIMSSLTINTDTIMVNSIYTDNNVNVDIIEMLDMSNKNEIMIHIIVSSNNPTLNRDEMIMMTSDWIYTTRNMVKSHIQLDTTDNDAIYSMISTLTDLIDFDLITQSNINDLSYSLEDPVLLKNNKIYTLRGVIVTDEDLDDDVVKIFEITYENHILRSLSVQYEYTYRSTMRQSNYISGVHYYFGETMIGEFPPLNTFYE